MSKTGGRVGLVTGFEPFAGLPTNPAAALLPHLAGKTFDGIEVVAEEVPVSLARMPAIVGALVDEYRPAFVLMLGLAAGAAVVRVETIAINAAHFGVADNDGAAPRLGIIDGGPLARRATVDAAAVVDAIEAAGVPARVSFHAGTHLCNAILHTVLGLVEGFDPLPPVGFLHLPYLPEQVVWLRREADGQPGRAWEQPSMALESQLRAVRAAVRAMARQAATARPGGGKHRD